MWVTSYLGIGSNLGDRLINIKRSIHYLSSVRGIQVKKVSRIFETPAQGGPKDQPEYLNAAVEISTIFTPSELLEKLQLIEKKLKRKKALRWGPRTIDLDILFFDDLVFLSDKLSIPHPLLHKRIFVLKPLSDIAPNLVHSLHQKKIKELLKEGGRQNEEIVPFN